MYKTIKQHRIIKWLILVFLAVYGLDAFAQITDEDSGKPPISSFFVKTSAFQKSGDLCFNVIRIFNQSDSPMPVKPILILPDGWALFSKSFVDTIIPSGDSLSLSFSFRISSKATADKSHQVKFQAYSMNNLLIGESNFTVDIEAFHKLDIIMPEKRVFFYPRTKDAEFDIIVVNEGNTTETITLDVLPDIKLSLDPLSKSKFNSKIELAANRDTTLTFKVNYTYPENRIFDVCRAQIRATTVHEELNRAILIEKYSDTYASLKIDKDLPHEIELGTRTFSQNKEVLPFIKARGVTEFNKTSNFRYNFSYYDLTETEDIIGNSYYQFLYTNKALNVGVGAFSSLLGRNLYSRNSIMVSNKMKISDASSVEGYTSFSFLTPKTSAALAYRYEKKEINMQLSLAYDIDEERKTNTTSVIYQSSKIPLVPGHEINVTYYGYQEYHYMNKKYTQSGLAWDFNYFGRINKSIDLQVSNNYGSPDIPGPQMGLLNFLLKSKYTFSDRKSYFSAKYANSSRDYYQINREGDHLPNILLKDQYANLLFHSDHNAKFRWMVGPSAEFFHSSTPTTSAGIYAVYDVQKYRFESMAYIGRYFVVNLKTGFSNSFDNKAAVKYEKKYDFHILCDFNRSGYGLRMAYDYGPMVNTGLYQNAIDASSSGINISPFMIKNYLGGLISFSLFANYNYRFDMDYGSLNINPKIESYLYRNWYAVIGGTYNYTSQVNNGNTFRSSFYYMEFAVKKKWGNTGKTKSRKELVRLKIQMFQDDNGNGVKDDFEKGVPSVKTRIVLTNTDKQSVKDKLPVEITLLSNETGTVYFNDIPKGFYDIFITPLSDVREYFYVGTGIEMVELLKTKTYLIPFQKANKILGQVKVVRQKFIKEGEENIDVTNIKITAYNNQGSSYSAFTNKEGRFLIYAPGGLTYYLRMENVFGKNFKIISNDIPTNLSESVTNPIIFEVVETKREIKFKKANQPAEDTAVKQAQKFTVLAGDLYNKGGDMKPADKNAAPEFTLTDKPIEEQQMIPGKYYVVIDQFKTKDEAIKFMQMVDEFGIRTFLGIENPSGSFFIYTNFYNSKLEAKKELPILKRVELKSVTVLLYEKLW